MEVSGLIRRMVEGVVEKTSEFTRILDDCVRCDEDRGAFRRLLEE